MLEKLFLGKVLEKIPSVFSWLYTFVLVVFGWIMFDGVAPGTIDFSDMFNQVFTKFGQGKSAVLGTVRISDSAVGGNVSECGVYHHLELSPVPVFQLLKEDRP